MITTEKIAICIACGLLNAWGGYSFLIARRYIMVSAMAVSVSYFLSIWWAGAMLLPDMGVETLSYKWFGKGNFARAVWLMAQSAVLGIGLVLTHHLNAIVYAIWCIGAAVVCGIFNNRVKQWKGDLIFGIWLSLILFALK